MFVLQVATVKGRGGVATAVAHYERMFRAVGVRSALVFRGPSTELLRAEGGDLIAAPRLLTSPAAAMLPVMGDLRAAVQRRRGGDDLVIIVHSDLALGAIRRLFADAVIIAPCHTDKTKRKSRADLVIALNPEQLALVQHALPRARVAMLGNPFVPAASESGPRAQASGPPRVNFLGRLEGFKDPLTLLHAFAAAKLAPEVHLRIIGEGPLEQEMRAAAAPSGRRVEFAGWLPNAFAHFDARDLLVLPSNWESYSYVIREALHYGFPVVASDIHVHRDALDGGAFGGLFPVGDAPALAATLESALRDLATLRTKAAAGGEALRARFGASAFFDAMRSEIAALGR